MLNNNCAFYAELLINGKKSPSFTCTPTDKLTFTFFLSRRLGAFDSALHLYSDSDGSSKEISCYWEGMTNGFDIYKATLTANETGLFYLDFKSRTSHGDICHSVQLTVYQKGYTTPDWIKGGIMYQIFCDRFAKSEKHPIRVKKGTVHYPDWENGIPQYPEKPGDPFPNNCFFGGSLYGIIEKLDYLQSLGVTTLYLNPIFDAASNHKYDTADYLKVDEAFGGDEALDALIKELKKRDMHIILDGVFNHTGADSLYFNKFDNYDSIGAYQSKASPYYDWFDFKKHPDDYLCWWGVKILPCIKKDSKNFREFICGKNGVAAHYLKKGVDGWRLDVADELSSEFLDQLRSTAREINDTSYILGEVWEDASNKIAYDHRRKYFQGTQLDAVMNYPIRTAIIDYVKNGNAQHLADEVTSLYRNYPKCVSDVLMNLLGTHDTERILNTLAFDGSLQMTNDELASYRMPKNIRADASERVKIAAFLSYTLPGVPCIYYGDEIGMEGGRDPFNRMPFAYSKADKSMLSFYRKLGALRSSLPCLADGELNVLKSENGIFIYKRGDAVCAVNMGASVIMTSKRPFADLFTGDYAVQCEDGRYRFSLPKNGFAVFSSSINN